MNDAYRKFPRCSTFVQRISLQKSYFFNRYLCADVVYVVLFPQLLLVLYAGDYTNTYGCLTAFITGFTLRVLSRSPCYQ